MSVRECFVGMRLRVRTMHLLFFDEENRKAVFPFFLKGVTSYMTVDALSREDACVSKD